MNLNRLLQTQPQRQKRPPKKKSRWPLQSQKQRQLRPAKAGRYNLESKLKGAIDGLG
jgi:hypothetical protein